MNVSADSTFGANAWASQFVASLRAECERARELLAANQVRGEQAESCLDEQIQRLTEALETPQGEAAARIHELETRLAESEERAAGGPQRGGDDELQRRYELALDDLRELKAKNGELQQQAARLRAANTRNIASGQLAGGALDWEAEKARILAVLESDSDDTAERCSERLKMEDVVRATDQVIAAKDRQIEELKRQLANLPPTDASPAAAGEIERAAILDRDEVIHEERAALQRLQQEWREKLRSAEIEISLERAAIARERAELESRQRPGSPPPQAGSAASTAQPSKPPRGRWLRRLGLAETEPHEE